MTGLLPVYYLVIGCIGTDFKFLLIITVIHNFTGNVPRWRSIVGCYGKLYQLLLIYCLLFLLCLIWIFHLGRVTLLHTYSIVPYTLIVGCVGV